MTDDARFIEWRDEFARGLSRVICRGEGAVVLVPASQHKSVASPDVGTGPTYPPQTPEHP
jgi:hypothetical protein